MTQGSDDPAGRAAADGRHGPAADGAASPPVPSTQAFGPPRQEDLGTAPEAAQDDVSDTIPEPDGVTAPDAASLEAMGGAPDIDPQPAAEPENEFEGTAPDTVDPAPEPSPVADEPSDLQPTDAAEADAAALDQLDVLEAAAAAERDLERPLAGEVSEETDAAAPAGIDAWLVHQPTDAIDPDAAEFERPDASDVWATAESDVQPSFAATSDEETEALGWDEAEPAKERLPTGDAVSDPEPADAAALDAAALRTPGLSDVAAEAAGTNLPLEPDAGAEAATEPEAESGAPLAPPSRWDAPVGAEAPERPAASPEARTGAVLSALRVLVLVGVAGGALYAGLLAIRQEDGEPAGTVRPPRVVETRSVPVEPGPAPRALRIDGFRTLRDLDLGGKPSRLVRWVPEAPAAVCESLAHVGWKPQDWGVSPLGDMSECLAERSFGKRGASGFAVLRGRATLSEIRIKLNLEDGAVRSSAARAAGALVAGLFDRWQWGGGGALGERIAALESFQDELFGTTVRLMREHGDVERWNLVLRFPTPPPPYEADERERALVTRASGTGETVDGEEQ